MTHEDAGHYAAKHPKNTLVDEKIAAAVKDECVDGKITCSAVHKTANKLSISPAEVGVAIDLLEMRIVKCQMGLFGYSTNQTILKPAEQIDPKMQEAIEESLTDGRLTCDSAWAISTRLDKKKLDVAAACEKLKIKICSCQIGSF
jgi:hypothetical protein